MISFFRILSFCLFLIGSLIHAEKAIAIDLGGTITANSATVTGDVTISTMSISTLTSSGNLEVLGNVKGLKGLVLQTIQSSNTITYHTTSTNQTDIPNMNATITLSNSDNLVRISLSGNLFCALDGFIDIKRDSTDLSSAPLAACSSGARTASTGITLIDSPGDTNAHTYKAVFYTLNSTLVSFGPTSFFLVEEIEQ